MNIHRKYTVTAATILSGVIRSKLFGITSAALLSLIVTQRGYAQHSSTGSWILNNNGNWSTTANWSGLDAATDYPSGIDAIANLNNNISANRTITLDVAVTLGILNIGDSSGGQSFTLSGGTLTFDSLSGFSQLNKTNGGGNDTISSNIVLNNQLDITVDDADNNQGLTLSGIISGGTAGTVTMTFNDLSIGNTVNWLILNNNTNSFQGQLVANSGLIRLESNNGAAGAVGVGNETIAQNGGSIDLRDRDFNIGGVDDTEIFIISGMGTNGLGALRNTAGNANLSHLVLAGDSAVGGYSRFDLIRHTDSGGVNEIAPILDFGGNFLSKFGSSEFVIRNGDFLNKTGGGFNVYEGELRFENNGALAGGALIGGTTYGNDLSGLVINVTYNRNAYDGVDPANGTRTSDPYGVNASLSPLAGNSLSNARISFGTYWGNHAANTKVTETYDNFTVNLNNGIWQREGSGSTGQTFDQIFGSGVLINLVGGGIGDDASGNGNIFDIQGGASGYNGTTGVFDQPGVTEIAGTFDNTSGGNNGTGFSVRGSRELRITGNNTAFDGDILIKQPTFRWITNSFDRSNGGQAASEIFNMSLAGANGSFNQASSITVTRWGTLALLNNASDPVYASANNNDRLNDTGILSLRNGFLRLNTDATVKNTENFGNVVADIGTNYLFLDTRAGGQFDGAFQTFTRNNGGVLKIYDANPAHVLGTGVTDDRIQLIDSTGLTTVGANAVGTSNQRIVVGLFGGVLPNLSTPTVAAHTRPLETVQGSYMYSGAGTGLMTLEGGYLRPLTASEYDTGAAPTAGVNWLINGYIAPSGGNYSDRNNFASRNVTADVAINSLSVSFDAAASGQAIPTATKDYIIIENGKTLTINSGVINLTSFVEANSANLETVIRGGNLSMNGGAALINSNAIWHDLDRDTPNWYELMTGNSSFIRSHIINATDLIRTGRNSLYLETWNDFTGNIYSSDQGSLIVRHGGALGEGAVGREVWLGGNSSLLLEYGTNISGLNLRVTNSFQGSATVLRNEGATNSSWGGDVILDVADASGNSEFQAYTITARNNGTLTLKGNVYTDNNANLTDSDSFADPPVVTTNIGESYTLNLMGQFRDVATGNLGTDPANAAITSIFRTGDSTTRLDANHSLRFQMTGHDEGNVNVFQQWDATGRLDLNRGYFRIMYDPANPGNDGTGFLTDGANALILGNDYWTRAALGADGAGTNTYHSHLMLTEAGQVFNWANNLYVYNNNRDGTLSIGGEHESGVAYIGSDTGANYQIIFENQGGDRDLRFTQVRGGTLEVKARLFDNGTSVNSIVTVSGPGTVQFNANGAGQSTVERWNFMGGVAIWAPRSTDGSMIGNDRFAVSTAQALFCGGDLTVLAETTSNRNLNLTGNVRVLNGDSTIRLVTPTGRTTNLNFGAVAAVLDKRAGGTLAFIEEGAGASNITLQATGLTNTGIMSWAVYGNSDGVITDFADNGASGAISAYAGYVPGAAEGDYIPANNVDVTGDVAFTTPASSNTLRFNAPVALSLDSQSMTLDGGAILITSANAGGNSISGGSLTSGFDANLDGAGTSRDLMIHNYGTGTLTVGATLVDNGADKMNLVVGGTGTTVLTANNTNTGEIYLNGGVLSISSEDNLGTIDGSIARLARVNNGNNSGASASLFFLTNGVDGGATGTFTASNNALTGTTLTSGGSGYTNGVYVNTKADGTGNAGVWAILDSGNLHFDGGTLAVTDDITLDGARTIFLGANGGTMDVAAGKTLTINGYITSEWSHINATNGYTANHLGGSDEQASNRNPDIGDLIVEGGGTVVLTGAPDNIIRSNMYNSYGGITWINNGTLKIASAGSSAVAMLGTNRSWGDGTVIGANGSLEFAATSDPTLYEWLTFRGRGFEERGSIVTTGTGRTVRLNGQMFIESDMLINNTNSSGINFNEGGGTFYGTGDIYRKGNGEFRFYANATDWTGRYISSGGNTRLYGAASMQGMSGLILERNTYFGYGAGSTSIDEFRDRLPDNLAVTANGNVRMRMEAGGGMFSGMEKLGTLTVTGGMVSLEYDLGADLIGGAPRLQGDYAGWHFTEIVRNPGTTVHLRNFDSGTSFADSTFNDTNFTNVAVVKVDVAPTMIGTGDGSNGNAPIVAGFFGGTRPNWVNLAGTGNIFNEDYTANRLVTVDTNNLGEQFLRPLLDSEYKVVANPDTAQTTSIAWEDQGITGDQNLKIVGAITDTGIGAGELTNRRNSLLTIGSKEICDPIEVNSLTFASESFVDGSGSGRGNYTALILGDGSTLKINSGVIQVYNTGVQNRLGAGYDGNVNLDIRSAINGGSVDFNGQEAIFNIGSLWAHYNTSDSTGAYRATDGDNNYLFMNTSIVNANGLTKTGPASLILAAPNYYSGNTTVSNGALYLRHDQALGSSSRVEIVGNGTLVLGYGARVSGADLYVGNIADNRTALQIENNSVWAGNVIIDNVDASGSTSFTRNFTPRIFNNSTGTGTIEGDIYGGTTVLPAGATISRMFSTYTGAAGLLDIRGQVRDTAAGAISGPITGANQAQVLRMEVVANNNEAAVQLGQQYDAAGRIRLLRGALYYDGSGDFYTAAAATAVNSAPLNSNIGFQMGGRSIMSGDGEGGANLSFFLANQGANFNLSSWEVGVESYDSGNITGNDNYNRGNTTGNSTLGGLNLTGSVNFGSGDGAITFTNMTRFAAYSRDLRLSAAEQGTVNINAAFVDGGSGVASSITKIGTGTVNLNGSSFGDSTVEGVNVLGGILNLTNYGVNANRRVGNGASLTLGGGTLVMDGSGASFTENFSSLKLNQGGNGIAAVGNGGNIGTVSFAGASITRAVGGSVHFQSVAGGVINFSNAAMQNVSRLGSYATFGANALATPFATDWAATDGAGNVMAYTGYGVDSFAAATHTDVQGAGLAANTTESVRFNTASGTITSGNLTLNDGGILFTSNFTSGTPIGSAVNVTTAAAGTDLIVHNYASGVVNFDGKITGAQNVVFTGTGELAFVSPSSVSGPAPISSTTVANSYNVTMADTTGLTAGMDVTGLNIPAGTKIVSITNGTTIVVSKLPTAAGTNNFTYSTTTYTPNSDYTGATHVTGSATVAFNNIGAFGSTSGFLLNGGTLEYSETGATSAALTQNIMLGGGNGTLSVADAGSTLLIRGTAVDQISSESNNVITAYGTNNPNNGGLRIIGSGTVQFGDRSAAAAAQDLLGVSNNYTGLTIIGDGVNAFRVDIQGQGNDNAQYSVFGATESWADATIVRNNATIEFSMKRGDGSRDNQIRFREWFQIGEQAGDQILFDGSTQRQPALDGVLNIIGDLTFQTQGNRYGDAGGTGNSEFLINPNEGGVMGSGNIIKLGDGNLRFYTPLHEWTGDLDIQDGYLGFQVNNGAIFNPTGTVYFGDPTLAQTSTIQMRIENRHLGNGTTSLDAPNIDLTFNRDIVVRDNLKQEVRIAAGYLPQSSMIHFTNNINVGSGSSAAVPVRFYYEDTTNLDASLVGHYQHAVFDITGNISGGNAIWVDANEGNAVNGTLNDIALTIWLRGDNSAWTGLLTIGADAGGTVDTDDTQIVRLGSVNALTDNAVNFRNNSKLQLGGINKTFTQDFLFTGGVGLATSSNIENAASTAATITFDSGSQTGPSYQDIGVGLRDGVAAAVFGGGSAALTVAKIGTGDTVFGASTGGGSVADSFSNYTGNTLVQQGTLYAGSNNAFSPNSRFVVSSGAELSPYWDQAVTGFDVSIGSLSGVAGASANIDGGSILRVGRDNTTDADFAGAIMGIGSFYKNGYGAQTLSGSNTFQGNLAVQQGTLIGASNDAFGDAFNVIALGGIALDGNNPIDARVELLLSGSANAVTHAVTMNSFDGNDEGITVIGTRATSGTYGFTTGGSVALYQDIETNVFFEASGSSIFQFGDAVTNAGFSAATNVVKTGAGTVELHAANSYGIAGVAGAAIDGGTVVRHGTLSVFDSSALASTVVELGDTHQALAANVDLATTRSLISTSAGSSFDPVSDGAGGAGNGAFLNVNAEVDGVSLTTADVGKRILVKDEGNDAERNGVYVVVSVDDTCNKMNLVRASDFDATSEMLYGTSVGVTGGTQSGNRFFMASVDVSVVNGDGTDPVYWSPELANPNVALISGVSGLFISNAIDINDTNGTGTTTIGGTFTTGTTDFQGAVTLQNSTLPGVDNVREVILTSASNDAGGGVIFSGGISEALGSTLSVLKQGTGTVTFANSNTYTGTTTVNEGTLVLDYTASDTGMLSDTSALILGSGTLQLDSAAFGTHLEIVASTTLTGAASVTTGTGSGAILQMNAITRNNGATVDFGAENIATTDTLNTNGILGGWATIGGTDFAMNSTNSADGLITAYTAYTDVTRLSSGTKVIADGAASNVRIIEGTGGAANITLGAATTTINSLNQSTEGGTSAATINFGGTNNLRVNSILVGTGAGDLNLGAAVNDGTLNAATAGGDLIVQNHSSSNLNIRAVIANNTSASSLSVGGTGRTVLTGSNTYTGATRISSGNLQVGIAGVGQTGTGATSLNGSAAVLSGTGLVQGGTVVALGTIRPGDVGGTGVGTLSFSNNLTYTGGTTELQISGALSNDLIDVGGTLTLSNASNIVVSFSGFVPLDNTAYSWDLLDWSVISNPTGFSAGVDGRTGGLGGGNLDLADISGVANAAWDISQFYTTGVVSIVVVPEPSRAVLLLLGLIAMLRTRRRK